MLTTQDVITLIVPVLPTVILIIGGQAILNLYARKRKEIEIELELERSKREKELDLIRTVREKQYASVEALYCLFSKFMELYRISTPKTNLIDIKDEQARNSLLREAIAAEAEMDSLIIRIGVEFGTIPDEDAKELSALLGNLRQSVQKWRETFRKGETLPFGHAMQEDYLRFKQCFVRTATFLIRHFYSQLDKPNIDQEKTWSIVVDAFDNKHEILKKWTSIFVERTGKTKK